MQSQVPIFHDMNLPSKDVRLIRDIVAGYSNETIENIYWHLRRIFAKDITPRHHIVFGQVIGELHRPVNKVLHTNLN